jgi:hypothetical protein
MELITKEILIKSVAGRWKANYFNPRTNYWSTIISGDTEIVYKKLLKATSEKEVNDIIGNKYWTELHCDDCKKEVDAVVQLGDEPDYESATANICFECLEKAIGLKGN